MAANPKIHLVYDKPSVAVTATREILLREYGEKFDLVYVSNCSQMPQVDQIPRDTNESLMTAQEANKALDFDFGDMFVAFMDHGDFPFHRNKAFWKKVFTFVCPKNLERPIKPIVVVTERKRDSTTPSYDKEWNFPHFTGEATLFYGKEIGDSYREQLIKRIGKICGVEGSLIFISYSSEDGELLAREMYEYLLDKKREVFFADKGPSKDDNYWDEIKKVIEGCGCVLFIDTAGACRAKPRRKWDHVSKEIGLAQKHAKAVYSAILETEARGRERPSHPLLTKSPFKHRFRIEKGNNIIKQEDKDVIYAALRDMQQFHFQGMRSIISDAREQLIDLGYDWKIHDCEHPHCYCIKLNDPNQGKYHVYIRKTCDTSEYVKNYQSLIEDDAFKKSFRESFFIHDDREYYPEDEKFPQPLERLRTEHKLLANQHVIHWMQMRKMLPLPKTKKRAKSK